MTGDKVQLGMVLSIPEFQIFYRTTVRVCTWLISIGGYLETYARDRTRHVSGLGWRVGSTGLSYRIVVLAPNHVGGNEKVIAFLFN